MKPHEKDVRGQQHEEQRGNDTDVKVEESSQRLRADVSPAAEHVQERRPDQRHLGDHVRPDRRRPVGELVVHQRVARKGEAERCQEQPHADHPRELARTTIAARDEDADHVQKHRDHHQLTGRLMEAAHQPSESHRKSDLTHALIGVHRLRHVVERQENASDHQHGEEHRGRPAQGPEPGLQVDGQAFLESRPAPSSWYRQPLRDRRLQSREHHAVADGGRTVILTKTCPSRTSTG